MAAIAAVALTSQLLTTTTTILLTATAATYGSRPTLILSPYEIPEGLEVGSTVSYDPSGSYNWEAQYSGYSSDQNLSSASGEGYDLNEWRVLSIDEMTGQVELVPTSQTSSSVYLQGAQGYNNIVKLLDEACNSLYGNGSKGITARSIDLEDIESRMNSTSVQSAKENCGYGTQYGPYSSSNSYYPSIYDQEKAGLGMSEQKGWIGATDNGASNGYIHGSGLTVTQTYWSMSNSEVQSAFLSAENGTSYYSLLMPKGTSSTYWLASRCVDENGTRCYFNGLYMYSGNVDYYYLFFSNDYTPGLGRPLFPVVSLSSELISGNSSSGYTVN